MEEVHGLYAARQGCRSLQAALTRPECTTAAALLQEAASHAVATLRSGDCTDRSLLYEVATVYGALDKALCLGAKGDFGDGCAAWLTKLSKYHPRSEPLLESMYNHGRSRFIEEIAACLAAVLKASTGALEG